jgi:diguanylate cyclase (GGDEF)-like protein
MNNYNLDANELIKMVLDSVDSLIFISEEGSNDQRECVYANKALLNLLNFNSLLELRKNHNCVLELFEKIDSSDGYLYFDKSYADVIKLYGSLISKKIEPKAVINVDGVQHHFKVNISPLAGKNIKNTSIFSLTDISKLEQLKSQLEQSTKKIYEASITDGLTHTFNRLYFNEYLQEMIKNKKRYDTDFSLAILDIDFFKKVNDTYGHLAGDDVLIELSKILMTNVRETDKVFRYGGEEFAIILPKTSIDGSKTAIEHLRKTIQDNRFTSKKLTVTCSIGLSEAQDGDDISMLIGRADKALYKAKNSGRNRSVVI